MTRAIFQMSFAALIAVGLCGSASAADHKSNVVTLHPIEIIGRARPVESVDVGTIAPKLALPELRQAFVDRVGEAIRHDPF
jgi:hypothetical protein